MRDSLTAQGVNVITERLRFLPSVDDTSGIVEQLSVCVISNTKTHTVDLLCYLTGLSSLHCTHVWLPTCVHAGLLATCSGLLQDDAS